MKKKEKPKPPPMRIVRDPGGGRLSCILVFAVLAFFTILFRGCA